MTLRIMQICTKIPELQWCLLCVDTSVAMSDSATDVDETLFEIMDRTQLEASS